MEPKKKALGRGLEQLFSNELMDLDRLESDIISSAKEKDIVEINIKELRSNPYQPRKHFEEESLKEMAETIKLHGVFQPIIVKKTIKGYEIIAGERRTKASLLAGKETIPAIIKDFTDEEMMEIALLENLQREDLSSIEEAMAYKNIIESLQITQEEMASKLGKSRSYVTNTLGLLKLPLEVQDMVLQKEISSAHARILSKLEDHNKIINLSKKIIEENMNVRTLEKLISNDNEKKNKPIIKDKKSSYYSLENYMKYKLGTKVNIANKKIEILFSTDEDLKRIIDLLNIKYED